MTSVIYFVVAAAVAQIASVFFSSSLGIIGFLYLVNAFTAVAFFFILLAIPETKVICNHTHHMECNTCGTLSLFDAYFAILSTTSKCIIKSSINEKLRENC